MDNEQPHQELVKCVVVGDTAVGKTRLICARACNSKLDINQFLTTHIPTVWAIDQYRMRKDVLERSCEVVDKVSVSLRLWDTFGDHEKDRRFAYGRSDVVLLCFSIANPVSLRNCKAVWYPEIRKFCPNTPIVLVACKNDLRHMYRDEKFLKLWRERSPFFRANHTCSRFPELSRPLRESDILTPEQGRTVAAEISAPYYESSAFTHYGVNEVFENVIRIALIARRQQRFWMTNLKPVQSAMLQKPFCPPRPNPPSTKVPLSDFEQHMSILLECEAYTDAVLILGNCKFCVHKIILAAASSFLHKLFTQEINCNGNNNNSNSNSNETTLICSTGLLARSASDSSISSSVDNSSGTFNADTELLLSKDVEFGQCNQPSINPCAYLKTALLSLSSTTPKLNTNSAKRYSSCANLKDNVAQIVDKSTTPKTLQHPLFQIVSNECFTSNEQYRKKSTTSMQTVLTLSPVITKEALRQCLHFMYTGLFDKTDVPISEVLDAAELFQIDELVAILRHIELNQLSFQEYFSDNFENKYIKTLQCRLKALYDQNLFTDVCFQFEDGACFAHKPLLMARCDMMDAMFRGYFRESSAKVVQFPGVSQESFRQFMHYIYSDVLDSSINVNTCLSLLELANRLCSPHLVALIESKVVTELDEVSTQGADITEHAMRLLEPCQMHNADQLAEWCLYQITIHYNEISHKNMKLLRSLHPENQAYLNRNRWPPVWYLKELDFYDRCVREKMNKKTPKGLKRHRNTGCLCFSGKSKRKDRVDY